MGVALTIEPGRITDCLFRPDADVGVNGLCRAPKPGSVLGVSGKADRSRGVPFIFSCGSRLGSQHAEVRYKMARDY